jgi:hypothetical protein
MSDMTLSERMRKHVQDRGGLSRDAETGEIVLPNGAWAMMLEAATALPASKVRATALEGERDGWKRSYELKEAYWVDHANEIFAAKKSLEAQLARAREAWTRLAQAMIDTDHDHVDTRWIKEFAREALRSIPAPADGRGEEFVNFGPSEHGRAIKAKRDAERAAKSKDLPSDVISRAKYLLNRGADDLGVGEIDTLLRMIVAADTTPKPDLPSEARADGRLAKIMQYIEDIMIEAEVDFPAGREAGPRISYDSDAIEKFLASVLGAPQPPTEARADGVKETVRKALASCEGEQYAFEEWAKKRGLNMEEHPMFYIFTDKTTDHARYAWKACLNYAREHVTPLLDAALTAQDHADVASQGASLPDDMVRLIIAARIVAYGDEADAKTELDKAVEAFADRVPWDEEPDDVASQGGDK